jgi:hypothetical protein
MLLILVLQLSFIERTENLQQLQPFSLLVAMVQLNETVTLLLASLKNREETVA